MINILISALLPLTLMLCFILLIRQPLRMKTDANTAYRLWLLIPLCLVLYFLPMPWQYLGELSSSPITSYLVEPGYVIEQHLATQNSTQFWLITLWLSGSTTLSVYWLSSHISYKQKLKLSAVTQEKSINKFNQAKQQMKNLELAQSSHLHSPILIGLIKQTLVIPEDFNELYSNEQQQLIIDHEVCHYSHYHMWTNQLALVLLAVFWFHPLTWRAYAAFRQDQEHSCDQFVLARKQIPSRIQYCKALVLAAETSPPNAFTLMSFKHNGEQNFMFNRIEQIKSMNTNKSNNKVSKLAVVAIISSSLLAGISYAGNQLKHDAKTMEKQTHVHPTHRIEPKYPVEAAQAGIEGSVLLKFDIIADGSVTNVNVVNAKPAYVFDETATVALKQWRYKATGEVTEDLLVQLDFAMGPSSAKFESLVERVQVIK